MEILLNIVLSFIFTALGVVLALWYENRGAVNLEFSQMKTETRDHPNGRKVRFLQIKVKNNPKRAWLVSRQTATSCHGTVSFYTENGSQVGNSIPIKWDGTPEPIKFELDDNGQYKEMLDLSLFRFIGYIDIPPDEEESLAIAVKIDGDECAYGWTANSYVYGWRYRGCELPEGMYTAKIKIKAGDSVYQKDYLVNNKGTFDCFDFVNEPINKSFFQRIVNRKIDR